MITALSVATRIGVHTWEQCITQRLLIDINILTNFTDCRDDDITTTIDYDKLCHHVTHYVQSNTFHLIETVAQSVALLLKNDFDVPKVVVSVSKPHAVANAGNITVTVTR